MEVRHTRTEQQQIYLANQLLKPPKIFNFNILMINGVYSSPSPNPTLSDAQHTVEM